MRRLCLSITHFYIRKKFLCFSFFYCVENKSQATSRIKILMFLIKKSGFGLASSHTNSVILELLFVDVVTWSQAIVLYGQFGWLILDALKLGRSERD